MSRTVTGVTYSFARSLVKWICGLEYLLLEKQTTNQESSFVTRGMGFSHCAAYYGEARAMKAFVDRDVCIGCGLCEGICPKVFKMAEDGIAEAVREELDEILAEEAGEAEAQCPVNAITVK